MSEAVKAYASNDWTLPGMKPLQISLVLAGVVTALSGVLANPLLTLANSSVARTPLLQRSVLARSAELAVVDQTSPLSSPSVQVAKAASQTE